MAVKMWVDEAFRKMCKELSNGNRTMVKVTRIIAVKTDRPKIRKFIIRKGKKSY